MMKINLAIVCIVAVSACSSESTPKADSAVPATEAKPTTTPDQGTKTPDVETPDVQTVSATGYGAVQFGMTLAAANTALHDSLHMKKGDPEACQMLRPAGAPAGVSLMVLKDTILRVDVDAGGSRTSEGVGIGDAEAKVKEAYAGRVTVQPHKYTGPKGHYLVISSSNDATHRIIFETDGTVVTKYHAGLVPAVDLVEKCL